MQKTHFDVKESVVRVYNDDGTFRGIVTRQYDDTQTAEKLIADASTRCMEIQSLYYVDNFVDSSEDDSVTKRTVVAKASLKDIDDIVKRLQPLYEIAKNNQLFATYAHNHYVFVDSMRDDDELQSMVDATARVKKHEDLFVTKIEDMLNDLSNLREQISKAIDKMFEERTGGVLFIEEFYKDI